MEKVWIDLFKEWDAEKESGCMTLRFPKPQQAAGFFQYGFVRKNDSAADFVDWYGFSLEVKAAKNRKVPDGWKEELTVTVFFADEKPLETRVGIILQEGKAMAEIPLSLFPLETVKGNHWEFVTGIRIVCSSWIQVYSCIARRREGIYVEMPVKGRAGEPGERLLYKGRIYNCSSELLYLTAEQVFEGWESLMAQICMEGNGPVIRPGESISFTASVEVHDSMVPGGHENTRIRVRGQGSRRAYEELLEVTTLRRLQHPYLYHDREGWKRVKENIARFSPYQPIYLKWKQTADEWVVTDPIEGRDFCYETKTETSVMSAAYLYALTREEKYAQKLADFYRRFSDAANGYPARKKGCSQSYVQEGHFFKHLAIAYDIICDTGVLPEEEKEAVECCFRLYMEMLDVHILDGHISNWILSELQGAFFCALTLQDMERALRFAFGTGGIVEQFRHGVFNDGWWHECSVGYNTWVSSIMLHCAHALRPFGYNLIHTWFESPYNREVSAVYGKEASAVKFGMYNQKWGGSRKNYVCIKDMFDAPLPFLDYRGVLFGIADSDEKKLSGVHFGSTYDLAYYYFRDERYLRVIHDNEPDPVFGDPNLQTGEAFYSKDNAFADNIGLALLRSQKEGRPKREQIQAVLRYGSHGGAHGHFDITNLLSVMRYGRSFYNPENCWWGYAHFMYKFYVQNSLTKNMVVVDEKLQVPADSKRILIHSEKGLQAVGVAVKTRWAYPPYGGMVYEQDGQAATKEELRRRSRLNGCYLPIAEYEGSPAYGELTGYTEPIVQKRVMAVTDDYIALFDYLAGNEEHQYDSLMQIKGFQGIEGENVAWTRHTEQMNENPVSDAQFITDCSWYEVKGGSVARFLTVFTEEHAEERMVCDRSNYNEPGNLHMDVYTAWPLKTEQMAGRVAVYDGWAADGNGYTIPLSYSVALDGEVSDRGAFDGWILGKGRLERDISRTSLLTFSLSQGMMHDEIGNPVKTPQGVFWGEILLELADGTTINLGQCLKEEMGSLTEWAKKNMHMENVDTGFGIGRDYKDGRVTIVGREYPYALPASPLDHDMESRIILDISSLEAVKLTACVGVDAFAGDEWQKRKTYGVRTYGKVGRFVTVIEPYEEKAIVKSVSAEDADHVTVMLADGRRQRISLSGMEGENPEIALSDC